MLRGGETFDEMCKERTSLYEKYADAVIDKETASIEDTVWAVVKAIDSPEKL